MRRLYALDAIRAVPWAIQPEWLPSIEAIAARMLEAPSLDALRSDGHTERYQDALCALSAAGDRLPGTNTVRVNGSGVATIPLMGPIFPRANMMTSYSGATSLDTFMSDFNAAQSSANVRDILIVVDSPGGVTTGISDAARQIGAATKPVTAYVTGMAASAAYWMASQAKTIVMDDTALAGSIGVVISGASQVQPDQNGRQYVDVVSSNAPNKRLDLTSEDDQATMRAVLDDVEAVFIAAVAQGRGVSVAQVKQNFGQGGMKAAQSAVSSGMADSVGTLADTIARLGAVIPSAKPAPRRAAAMADLQNRRIRAQGH